MWYFTSSEYSNWWPVNYENFLLWLVRTQTIPGPMLALKNITSNPFGVYFSPAWSSFHTCAMVNTWLKAQEVSSAYFRITFSVQVSTLWHSALGTLATLASFYLFISGRPLSSAWVPCVVWNLFPAKKVDQGLTLFVSPLTGIKILLSNLVVNRSPVMCYLE